MKKINLSEAKFVSMFGSTPKQNNVFYSDGDFVITNDKIKKARDIFYPFFEKMYNGDKDKIIHKIAFSETMKMIDSGELPALPQNSGNFYSLRNRRFSIEQVENVEKQITPNFENMSLEELYDYLLIDMERNNYDSNKKGKEVVEELINNGFFDEYMKGQLKNIALLSIGKLDDTLYDNMITWLYTKNRFTHKLNIKTINEILKQRMDEIADSDDDFMFNKTFIALNEIESSLSKIKG